MNYEYILENSKRFNLKKKVIKTEIIRTRDAETGDTNESEAIEYGYCSREPDYIKVYNDYSEVVTDFNLSLLPYLIYFCENLTYANDKEPIYQHTICTNEYERKRVASLCNVSENRVKQVIKDFVASEVFIPIKIDGKRIRGRYFVNPWVVSRGDWYSVYELRKSFEPRKDVNECYTYLADNGKRKTVVSRDY